MKGTLIQSALIALFLVHMPCFGYSVHEDPITAENIYKPAFIPFRIALPVHPSSGYTWYLVKNYEPKILQVISKTFEHNPTLPINITGQRAQEIFTLKLLRRTNPRIRFEYRRSWENKTQPPTQVREFVITAQ